MLDINLLLTDKGGNPELVRESQKRRNASVEIVDEVIELYNTWKVSKLSF
jgi:seryl-tRNA synthetase